MAERHTFTTFDNKPKVFISYARKDGREFAAMLRQRLVSEGFPIWQDVVSEIGGEDWWLQIAEAIENVATMVLVVTPEMLKETSVVRREWVHARRFGTHIMPVVFDPDIFESENVPRWISRVDCFVLAEGHPDLQQTFERFLRQLATPSPRRPVPFMVLPPPEQFVRRPRVQELLIERLLDAKGNPRPVHHFRVQATTDLYDTSSVSLIALRAQMS